MWFNDEHTQLLKWWALEVKVAYIEIAKEFWFH